MTEKESDKKKSISGLGTVVIRNEFYRDGYRSLLKMTLIQSIVILGLVGAMYYTIKVNQPQNFYFATTEDGRLVPMVPLGEPNLSTPALMSWVAQATTEVMTFGKRADLLDLARWKIKNKPREYIDHIFGEHEVGGTSWMYLASDPLEKLGYPKLGTKAAPRLTEAIQHGVFQGFAGPLLLFGALGGFMWLTERKGKASNYSSEKEGGR